MLMKKNSEESTFLQEVALLFGPACERVCTFSGSPKRGEQWFRDLEKALQQVCFAGRHKSKLLLTELLDFRNLRAEL